MFWCFVIVGQSSPSLDESFPHEPLCISGSGLKMSAFEVPSDTMYPNTVALSEDVLLMAYISKCK